MKKKIFCEDCVKEVEYEEVASSLSDTLKDKTYSFEGKTAICPKCGNDLFPSDLIDYNLKALYDAYRNENDIISLEKIREIPERYNISRRNLSLILDWGAHTFERYYDGNIPSKQYSSTLKKIYESPSYYLNLIDAKKDLLKDETAYKKTREAAEKLNNFEFFVTSPIQRLAIYIIKKSWYDITNLALQKLIYFSQAFCLVFNSKPLINDDCEAWTHGPVYTEIYHEYKKWGSNFIKTEDKDESLEEPYADDFDKYFSAYEKEIIDNVIKYFGCYSGSKLRDITHSEDPWLQAREGLKENDKSNQIITKDSIEIYFNKVCEKHSMIIPSDIKKYSKEIFEKIM